MERTALSPGEIKQLLLTVQQGVQLDELPPGLVRKHIGPGKTQFQDLLMAVLRLDPSERWLRRIHQMLMLRFRPEVADALAAQGFSIIDVPHGLTLWEMRFGLKEHHVVFREYVSDDFFWPDRKWHEPLPTKSRQVAWCPRVLPGSKNRKQAEHAAMISKFNQMLPDGCRGIMGSAEEYTWVFGHFPWEEDTLRRLDSEELDLSLRCRNHFVSGTLRVDFSKEGVWVGSIEEGDLGDIQIGDLYLSPLVVPW